MTTTVTFYDGATEHTICPDRLEVFRGRNRELDVIDVGGGTIDLTNFDREFDPYFVQDTGFLLQLNGDNVLQLNGDKIIINVLSNATGPYGPIVQGRKIVIKDGSDTVFTGFVEDYDYTWRERASWVQFTVTDALATLGGAQFNEWTATAGQNAGERITSALNRSEVGFPSGATYRDIEDGIDTLQGDTVSFGTNVLNYLQLVAKSDFGRLFVSRAGKLTYRNRHSILGDSPILTFTDNASDTDGVPFSGVEVAYGSEQLHFSVSCQRVGGSVRTSTNSDQIAAYPELGARHLAIGGLLLENDYQVLAQAQFLEDRYSQFRAIVNRLTVELFTLTPSMRSDVATLEIGDVIALNWTPTGEGAPVQQTLVIEGIGYRVEPGGIEAYMDLQLSDASDFDWLTTNDADLGRLDVNRAGF